MSPWCHSLFQMFQIYIFLVDKVEGYIFVVDNFLIGIDTFEIRRLKVSRLERRGGGDAEKRDALLVLHALA